MCIVLESNCQDLSFPKSSLLISGGANAEYFHIKADRKNEINIDMILGIGYSMNSKNAIGLNLDYFFNGIYFPTYSWRASRIVTGVYYRRYFNNNFFLGLYSGLGNNIQQTLNPLDDPTDYKIYKYGGSVGKTFILSSSIAVDIALSIDKYIMAIEKYRPELGNMEITRASLDAGIIYYFTISNQKP